MTRVLALVMSLLATVPAHAAYSGLTLIPTADTLAAGHVCADYQLDGPFPVGSGAEVSLLNTQLGVGSQAEAGVDFDFSEGAETGVLFNAKLLLRPEGAGLGLAAGVFNIGDNLAPSNYLAATAPVGARLRLHAGVLFNPGATDGFAGLDYAMNDRTQVWAEYVGGEENASALSLAYQLSRRWAVSFAWQRPNDHESDDSFSLHIGCARTGG